MNRAFLPTLLAGLLFATATHAASVNVAVAANFTNAAEALAEAFKAETGNDVVLSFGATGGLYTQITQAAPFEVFLSADDTHPARAIEEGFGVEGTNFTYAIGALALYSTTLDVSGGEAALDGGFGKFAIANPETAPYGVAAVQALKALGKYDALSPKFVVGENITQALQFVETGNAEVGFVASSQVVGRGSQWIVPPTLYKPLVQDAVLLKTGQANPVASQFLEYLRSDAAVEIVKASGYTTP